MSRKQSFTLLKIAVSLIAIALIFTVVDLEGLTKELLTVNPWWLIVAIALVMFNIVPRAKRWQILLNALAIRVPLKELVTIYFIGSAFNNFLPSAVGGDAIRAMELRQHTDRVSDAITSVLVDRFLGLYGSIVLGIVALLFAWQIVPLIVLSSSLIVFVGMTTVGAILVHAPLYYALRRISLIRFITDFKPLTKLFESFQGYPGSALWRAFGAGLLVNVILIAINIAIGTGLGMAVSPLYYFVFIPLVNLSLVLPAFAGFGARETAYIFLFAQVGVPEETALALSLLIFAAGNLAPGLTGGVIYLWRNIRALRMKEETR